MHTGVELLCSMERLKEPQKLKTVSTTEKVVTGKGEAKTV